MAEERGVTKLLPNLPRIESIGLNRVTDGPPLPAGLSIKWPEPMRNLMKKNWPGAPFPREWGEKVMPYLPLGLGDGVLGIIDSLGL